MIKFPFTKEQVDVNKYLFTGKKSRIVDMLYMRLDGLSFEKIGDKYGLSRERVRQLVEYGSKVIILGKLPIKKSLQKNLYPQKINSCMILSSRTINLLTSQGIHTIGGLSLRHRDGLLSIDGFGEKCLLEVENTLSKYGLQLRHD